MDVIFDLFGNAVPVGRGKRGRPEHVPTIENRNRVRMLLAVGWSNDRIANALAITLPTLRKHYFSELKARAAMRDRMDARRLERAWIAAETGNVGAMKEYDRLVEKNDLMQAQQSFEQSSDKPDAPKRGKKEQAAIDAETAGEGSEWGDDLIFRDGASVN